MIENDKKIMRGEFRGDFTRDTFDPMKAFSRVLMQQGRVQLDADWNEQTSILLHMIRNLTTDICGPHWGPAEGAGFEIGSVVDNDFTIGAGHYYVDGILCEVGINEEEEKPWTYLTQPNHPLTSEVNKSGNYLVYLDVWERHISYVEDDAIREKALGGPDTASRAQVVWQVKVMDLEDTQIERLKKIVKGNRILFLEYLRENNLMLPGTGKLQARLKDKTTNENNPCLVAPESRYRGAENQLYRVEIHRSNEKDTAADVVTATATFKWSRENASVIFPILEQKSGSDTNLTFELEHLGRDARFSLKPNDWVEIVDDDYILQNRAEKLLQVESIDHDNRQVTLRLMDGELVESTVKISESKSTYLRRWDHSNEDATGDGIPIKNDEYIDIENGIQIKISDSDGLVYQTGDYWLIPARTATGDIEWPSDGGNPKEILAHGVVHHYAPLAIIGDKTIDGDLRRILAIPFKVGRIAAPPAGEKIAPPALAKKDGIVPKVERLVTKKNK